MPSSRGDVTPTRELLESIRNECRNALEVDPSWRGCSSGKQPLANSIVCHNGSNPRRLGVQVILVLLVRLERVEAGKDESELARFIFNRIDNNLQKCGNR